MKEVLQRRLWREFGKKDPDKDKIDRITSKLHCLDSQKEKAEAQRIMRAAEVIADQIREAAKALIIAENPPPSRLFI